MVRKKNQKNSVAPGLFHLTDELVTHSMYDVMMYVYTNQFMHVAFSYVTNSKESLHRCCHDEAIALNL